MSPNIKKPNTATAHEPQEEVIQPRRHTKALSEKFREPEIENVALPQKGNPPSYLLNGRKTHNLDESFNPQKYYSTLTSKENSSQKKLAGARKETFSAGQEDMTLTSLKDEANSTKNSSYYPMNRIDFWKINGERTTSSPEVKRLGKDFNIPGYGLPRLKEAGYGGGNEILNNSSIEGASQFAKNSNNVWMSGFIKKRANSTLRKNKLTGFSRSDKE